VGVKQALTNKPGCICFNLAKNAEKQKRFKKIVRWRGVNNLIEKLFQKLH